MSHALTPRARAMRSWPKALALTLGAIPVVVLVLMVVSLVAESRDAVFNQSQLAPTVAPAATPAATAEPGASPVATPVGVQAIEDESPVENLKTLFGTDFSTIFSSGVGRYGLTPAIVGTISIVIVALGLAFPVSLAMGIFASEFPLGFLGRALRMILGVLSGIPPVVYALLAVVFVAPFISNKFTADWTFGTEDPAAIGADPEAWPPGDVPWSAGAFPWDPTGIENSALLGGIMLALLAIPFMAPLIEDAIANVSREPKEASVALGATRWYTLRRITLRRALPGIIAALGLGTLKVMGDVLIVLFVVGFDPPMPSPVFDVLERTAPLTSTGAALLGGVSNPNACQGAECSVGYFSALLLLLMAVFVVFVTGFLERRVRKRLAL